MTISVVGGKEHLKTHYEKAIKARGHKMKLLLQNSRRLYKNVGNVNGIIIFTDNVSHNAAWSLTKHAKTVEIPIVRGSTSSIASLKKCINEIENGC